MSSDYNKKYKRPKQTTQATTNPGTSVGSSCYYKGEDILAHTLAFLKNTSVLSHISCGLYYHYLYKYVNFSITHSTLSLSQGHTRNFAYTLVQ